MNRPQRWPFRSPDVLGVFDGAFGCHPARVVDVLRLEQQNPYLLLGDGPVLDPFGTTMISPGPTSTSGPETPWSSAPG